MISFNILYAVSAGPEIDLGQWRAYADNGCGFAIGFDGEMLEGAFIKDKNLANISTAMEINYEETELREVYGKISQKLTPVFGDNYKKLLEVFTYVKISNPDYHKLRREGFAIIAVF